MGGSVHTCAPPHPTDRTSPRQVANFYKANKLAHLGLLICWRKAGIDSVHSLQVWAYCFASGRQLAVEGETGGNMFQLDLTRRKTMALCCLATLSCAVMGARHNHVSSLLSCAPIPAAAPLLCWLRSCAGVRPPTTPISLKRQNSPSWRRYRARKSRYPFQYKVAWDLSFLWKLPQN